MEYIESVKEINKMIKKEAIKEFSSIKGIGKSKAELLYDNGFDSLDKINKSSIKKLTEINGINEKLANHIKNEVKNLIKIKDIKNQNQKLKKDKELHDIKKIDDKELEKKETTIQEKDEINKEKKYQVKKKPKLTKDQINFLRIRKNIKKRTPNFLREEWFRYKRIPNNWRRPDGITSKMRINLKYRPNKVRIGYRVPKEVRGLHPSGFEEVLIHNINELQNIDNKKQAIRIGRTIGTKKRIKIEKKAEDLDIRILNISGRKND
jgi:large subunit ribosomal protein L32e